MVDKVMYSSASMEWGTPQWLYDALDAEFRFTLDPCSTDENKKCEKHFTVADDGLAQDWGDNVVFVNPPYGRQIGKWVQKAYESADNGAVTVCLIPSRTDTKWWHRYCMRGEIRLLRGRLRFVGGEHSAPFPSAIVIFRGPNFKLRSFDGESDQNKHLWE